MVFNNNLLLGAAGAAGGYTIDQSIRFDNVDGINAGGAQMYRLALTGTPTSDKKATISAWVKRSTLGYNQTIAYSGDPAGSTFELFRFNTNDTITFAQASSVYTLTTNQVFRDVSAWYHIVAEIDTSAATAADRASLYVNGVKVTSFSTANYPSLNYVTNWTASGGSIAHAWGTNGIPSSGPSSQLFSGYMADMYVLDGENAGPTAFGEFNDSGVWIPKAYSGSFGNNGYYQTGENASALGEDFSGNNLDFTTVALATTDQRLDSPTLNKATLNGINLYTTGSVLSDGNLTVTNSGTSGFWRRAYATQALSYKTYWEVHADNRGSLNMGLSSLKNPNGGINNPSGNFGAGIQNNEAFVTGSYANESSGGRTFPISTGNYIMFAFDPDRGALWAGTEGTWKDGTASSASSATILAEIEGTGTSYALFTGIDADDAIPHIAQYSTSTATARFSSENWEGTAPTGYEQLAPSSLPDPTIADPGQYFNTVLFTGNSGTAFSVTGVGFQPDFVWGKPRSYADNHRLMDVVRGSTKQLLSNSTQAEFTQAQGITSFDSDGFTVGTHNGLNTGTNTYVAWCWLADNTTGSSNTDGSINTTATSVNTTAGFSISTYTGTGSNATVGHGLGIAPKMVIVKRRDSTSSWRVYHAGLTSAAYVLNMESTGAEGVVATVWNSTAPTSTVFSIGTNSEVNASGGTFVAYCFAEVEGFSKFGSYTGNGSTDGPFVYTGFKPAFVMTKRTNSAGDWKMWDNERGPYNVNGLTLAANTSGSESSGVAQHNDFLSNGFKIRGNDTETNGSGSTYIYMAFGSPFKTATAR